MIDTIFGEQPGETSAVMSFNGVAELFEHR
jgi:hypothetical protein